jgi:hypothetical protein
VCAWICGTGKVEGRYSPEEVLTLDMEQFRPSV